MSSTEEQANAVTPIEKLFPDRQSLSSSDANEIERLSNEVEELKNKLGDVIFISACFIIIIMDLFIFPSSQTWAAPVIISIFQIIFLWVIARLCRVNDIVRITDTILDAIDRYKGKSNS